MHMHLLPPIAMPEHPGISDTALAEARRVLQDDVLTLSLGQPYHWDDIVRLAAPCAVEQLSPLGRAAQRRLADRAQHWWVGPHTHGLGVDAAWDRLPWGEYRGRMHELAQAENEDGGVSLPFAGELAHHTSGTRRLYWAVRADGTTVEVATRPVLGPSAWETVPVAVRLRVPLDINGYLEELEVLQVAMERAPLAPGLVDDGGGVHILTIAGQVGADPVPVHSLECWPPAHQRPARSAHLRHLQALHVRLVDVWVLATHGARRADHGQGMRTLLDLIEHWHKRDGRWAVLSRALRMFAGEAEAEAEAEKPVPWTLPPPRDGRWAEDVEREALEEEAERTHRGVLDEPVDDADTADTADDVTPFGDPLPADLWEGTR
jgi:hypothetical protein